LCDTEVVVKKAKSAGEQDALHETITAPIAMMDVAIVESSCAIVLHDAPAVGVVDEHIDLTIETLPVESMDNDNFPMIVDCGPDEDDE
jgi:hypothetical protein